MTAISTEPVKFLSHGFVRVVDTMGDDSSIVQAARTSYSEGTKSVRQDRGLIRHLVRHRHSSPVEMCEIKFHLKMPIYIARQHIRHRTASLNEVSARYSVLTDEFEIPSDDQICRQSILNKQGRGDVIPSDESQGVQEIITDSCRASYADYEALLEQDVARETARSILPVATYTEMYWKIDLHNLFHYLKLRTDPHAQYEIRMMANIMESFVKQWVPVAHEAWVDYVKEARTFSRMEMEALKVMAQGDAVMLEDFNMSPRERREFADALGLKGAE